MNQFIHSFIQRICIEHLQCAIGRTWGSTVLLVCPRTDVVTGPEVDVVLGYQHLLPQAPEVVSATS